jgi:hypothetical protein
MRFYLGMLPKMDPSEGLYTSPRDWLHAWQHRCKGELCPGLPVLRQFFDGCHQLAQLAGPFIVRSHRPGRAPHRHQPLRLLQYLS